MGPGVRGAGSRTGLTDSVPAAARAGATAGLGAAPGGGDEAGVTLRGAGCPVRRSDAELTASGGGTAAGRSPLSAGDPIPSDGDQVNESGRGPVASGRARGVARPGLACVRTGSARGWATARCGGGCIVSSASSETTSCARSACTRSRTPRVASSGRKTSSMNSRWATSLVSRCRLPVSGLASVDVPSDTHIVQAVPDHQRRGHEPSGSGHQRPAEGAGAAGSKGMVRASRVPVSPICTHPLPTQRALGPNDRFHGPAGSRGRQVPNVPPEVMPKQWP